MQIKYAYLLVASLFLTTPLLSQDKALTKIESILRKQQNDWNNGDIDAFMQYYWKSEKLAFAGAKGVTYGWQATYDRYKKSYPDKATMGKLTFTLKDKIRLSRKSAMIVGKWELERASDHPNGHFMLVWKKVKGKWVIIADHTSVVN